MAKERDDLPGGVLACGPYSAPLAPDEWTALQWMRFRFSRPDSAVDRLLREQPIPPAQADELTAFVLHVHAQSGEKLFPLYFGRGAHLQREVHALVGRSPRRRGGPAYLRDVTTVVRTMATLGALARRAATENAPVTALAARTLLGSAWGARWHGEGDAREDDESMRALAEAHPEVGEACWRVALARCSALLEDAEDVASRNPFRTGQALVATLARRAPGFPDDVYRHAVSMAIHAPR